MSSVTPHMIPTLVYPSVFEPLTLRRPSLEGQALSDGPPSQVATRTRALVAPWSINFPKYLTTIAAVTILRLPSLNFRVLRHRKPVEGLDTPIAMNAEGSRFKRSRANAASQNQDRIHKEYVSTGPPTFPLLPIPPGGYFVEQVTRKLRLASGTRSYGFAPPQWPNIPPQLTVQRND